MTIVALRPSPKFQAFDANGDPLSGGKLYAYAAGTSTLLNTYTDATGTVANANPVILDSRGEADVWLQAQNYKLKLTDANDNTIWTVDNVSGTPYPVTDEWLTYAHTWTYVSATQVTVPGDQTAIYAVNKAVRATTTGGTYYGTITGSAYDGATKTTLTVSFETGSFDLGVAGTSTLSVGVQSILSPAMSAAQTAISAPGTSATSTTSNAVGTGSKTFTIQTGKNIVPGMSMKAAYTNSPTNWIHGDVTSYNSSTGELVINGTSTSGSGTYTAWTVSLSAPVSVFDWTPVTSAQSPYSVTQNGAKLLVDTSGGAVTINIGSGFTANQAISIKDAAGTFATNNCTLVPPAAKTVMGDATGVALTVNNWFSQFALYGTDWRM